MNLDLVLRSEIEHAVSTLFNQPATNIQLQPTNQEFEGSHTLVCFPLTKIIEERPRRNSDDLLVNIFFSIPRIVSRYNVVKGFLNLVLMIKPG